MEPISDKYVKELAAAPPNRLSKLQINIGNTNRYVK
jgi:hypothetical protein